MNIILGTAGHIDHGKTTLIRALTGIDCDRLAEEKKRGITIELGFAWLDLPDGRRIGIVDVPGHERFIKNMVAGASGVDCVLLVIAADEGIMPQTREHLEICALLGVKSGIVALTRADLVDEAWREMAVDEVKTALADTFLADAPIIPVSSVTGYGLEELRTAIIQQADKYLEKTKTDLFRLPVDRVFGMKGFGAIVTGTIIGGCCFEGEKLEVFPCGRKTRARSLQAHNTRVSEAKAGQRCAINLQGLETGEIQRGDVIARPDTLFPGCKTLVSLKCLESSPLPIRQRMEAHFYHGSRELLARIVLLGTEILEPGKTALAEALFKTPVCTVFGDHFIIRAHSPLQTIGGGTVIYPLPPLLKKRDPEFKHKLLLLEELAGIAALNVKDKKAKEKIVEISLELYPAPGTNFCCLAVLTGLSEKELKSTLHELEKKEAIFCWDQAGRYYISALSLNKCLENCKRKAVELHAKEPLKTSFPPESLISGWGDGLPQKFIDYLMAAALKNGLLGQSGSGVKLAGHEISMTDDEAKIAAKLLQKFESSGYSPPFVREILEEEGWEIKSIQTIINFLCESGELVKLQEGVYYKKSCFDSLLGELRNWFTNHEDLDIIDLKTLLGVSRKYAIPILEYLDASKFTYRVNNKRKLRKN